MKKIRQQIKDLIPPSLQFRLVSLKHTFTKFRQIHYSQNGEDIVLNTLFSKDYRGFYVDVGAHHPYRISNTYLLYKKGWSGINIDANPETIELFKKARPNDKNVLTGVSNSDQTLSYHRFSDPAVNTFSESEAEKWKNKNWIKYLGTTTVQTKKLSVILKENLKENQKIDVLSVDVEGFDLEVLQSNDWDLFSPKVIVVEAHDFKINNMNENFVCQLLINSGYELEFILGFSLFFIKKNYSL